MKDVVVAVILYNKTLDVVSIACDYPRFLYYYKLYSDVCKFFGNIVVRSAQPGKVLSVVLDDDFQTKYPVKNEYSNHEEKDRSFLKDYMVYAFRSIPCGEEWIRESESESESERRERREEVKGEVKREGGEGGEGIVFICNKEYPSHLMVQVCKNLLHDLSKTMYVDKRGTDKFVESWLEKMQNPAEVSKICKLKDTLKETEDVIRKTLMNVLERGDRIEDLVKQTDELEDSSKIFLTESHKFNSCCCIL